MPRGNKREARHQTSVGQALRVLRTCVTGRVPQKGTTGSRHFRALCISKAGYDVVIDESGRLQV